MHVIGITGKKRHGKNTVADIIGKLPGYSLYEYSFAGALKDEAARLLGVSREEMEKEKAVFRHFLQWYGTDFIRDFCGKQGYWIEKVEASINRDARVLSKLPQRSTPVFVITDVRFNNEALLVKRFRGHIIQVVNPRIENTDTHSSEKGIDEILIDCTITNDGTISELKQKVETLMKDLL